MEKCEICKGAGANNQAAYRVYEHGEDYDNRFLCEHHFIWVIETNTFGVSRTYNIKRIA